MKFYKNSNDNYVLGDKILSPNSSAYLQYSTDFTSVALVYNDKTMFYMPVNQIQKEDGTNYLNKDELELELKTFFLKSGGSTGTITEEFIFDDVTARDTFFGSNLDKLKGGLNIIVGTTDKELQTWLGHTVSIIDDYDTNNWYTYKALPTPSELKTLYESNTDTEALTTSKKELLDLLFVNSNGSIQSTVSWVLPPGFIQIGPSAKIHNGLRALNVSDPITGKRALLLAQIYSDSGSQNAFVYDIDPITEIVVNTDGSETLDITQFTRPIQNDEVILGVKLYTNNISSNVDVTFRVRQNSHTDPLVYDLTRSYTSDASGMIDITFETPLITDGGSNLYLEIHCLNMVGKTISGQFIPKHNAKIQLLYRKNILKEDDISDDYTTATNLVASSKSVNDLYLKLLNPTVQAIDSNDSNVIYGGFVLSGVIRKRNTNTNTDTYFQSSASTPITDTNNWTDWGNRETLIYN